MTRSFSAPALLITIAFSLSVASAQTSPPPLKSEPKTAVETKPSPASEVPVASPGEHLFGFHAALGFPHPISYGLNYVHPNKLLSAEVSTGSYSMTVDSVRAKIQNTEGALRYHPFAGSFFLGALFGTQRITGDKTDSTYGFTGSAEVKSNYLTPHLGWIWGQAGSGVFASFAIGYQSPSNVTTAFSSDASAAQQLTTEYQDLQTKVRDNAEKLGKMGLPYLGLFKIGYLF